MVSEVRRVVEEGPLGVRTLEKFVQACLERAAAGDPDAVALFVFAKLVEPFSDYYLDQALTDARAVELRDRLLSALSAYETAAAPEERLAVLRDVIRGGLEESSG